MMWVKSSFMNAVERLFQNFGAMPSEERLALIWRSPDEYTVMDDWMLDKIKDNFDGSTLRVCLWLTRQEAAELLAEISGGK